MLTVIINKRLHVASLDKIENKYHNKIGFNYGNCNGVSYFS